MGKQIIFIVLFFIGMLTIISYAIYDVTLEKEICDEKCQVKGMATLECNSNYVKCINFETQDEVYIQINDDM